MKDLLYLQLVFQVSYLLLLKAEMNADEVFSGKESADCSIYRKCSCLNLSCCEVDLSYLGRPTGNSAQLANQKARQTPAAPRAGINRSLMTVTKQAVFSPHTPRPLTTTG